jgi:hypothetical protein
VGLAKGRAVGLLQLAFEELAGLGARELLDKLDGTRRLEMCQSLAHVADDLLAKFGLPEVSTDGGLIGGTTLEAPPEPRRSGKQFADCASRTATGWGYAISWAVARSASFRSINATNDVFTQRHRLHDSPIARVE